MKGLVIIILLLLFTLFFIKGDCTTIKKDTYRRTKLAGDLNCVEAATNKKFSNLKQCATFCSSQCGSCESNEDCVSYCLDKF